MNSRKLSALFVSFLLVFALAACTPTTDDNGDDDNGDGEEDFLRAPIVFQLT